MPDTPTPLFSAERLNAALEADDPTIAGWAAAKQVTEAAEADLGAALAVAPKAGHAALDRLIDRITRAKQSDLAPAIREHVDVKGGCGVPVRALVVLGDPEGVPLATEWLKSRREQDAQDVGMVVHALAADGGEAALAAARAERDSGKWTQMMPLTLAFTILAETGESADAAVALTEWLRTPPSMWQGEEPWCALAAELGLAAVPVSWYAVNRKPREFFELVEQTTDGPVAALFPDDERRELIRHWQKRHHQEVVTRLKRATDLEALPAPLRAFVEELYSRTNAVNNSSPDDAGDLLALLTGAALLSHLPPFDASGLDADGLAQELGKPVRRLDPRHTKQLLERAEAIGDEVAPAVWPNIAHAAQGAGVGLSVAALLRLSGPARLPFLVKATGTNLPGSLLSGVIEALQDAGADGIPLLEEMLQDQPAVPTAAVAALVQAAPYPETAELIAPLLPRWLARSKGRALALCARLGAKELLPVLEDEHVAGDDSTAHVIRLIAKLHDDDALAAKYPPAPPKAPSALRGPDGRPIRQPMPLLLRCTECDHGYYYELRQVRITKTDIPFVEEDGPAGLPDGVEINEPVVCRRCGAEDQYRLTAEAMVAIRETVQQEMLMAMEMQMRQQQEQALRAQQQAQQPGGPMGGPGQQRPPQGPDRLSPGGIILP
ncbi:MAG: hypothetical protein ACYTGX_00125 [Planctomycetota bacterium]